MRCWNPASSTTSPIWRPRSVSVISTGWRPAGRAGGAIWRFYEAELAGLPLQLPAPPAPGTRHALHLFTCLVDDTRTSVTRDQVLTRLHALRIGAGVHYRAVHEHPFYRARYRARTGRLPNAEWVSARTFSLPLGGAMTDGDAADVVRALRHIFR